MFWKVFILLNFAKIMKWWGKKKEKKDWEDLVDIIEDIGISSNFPKYFENKEDTLKAQLYKEFKEKDIKELYKTNRQEYWRQCNVYIESKIQKHNYKIEEKR